jgi:hypothetical protein
MGEAVPGEVRMGQHLQEPPLPPGPDLGHAGHGLGIQLSAPDDPEPAHRLLGQFDILPGTRRLDMLGEIV